MTMHGSTNDQAMSRAKALWLTALWAAALMVATTAYADDDEGRRDKRRSEHRSWAHEHDRSRHERHDLHPDHHGWSHGGARDWRGYDARRYYAREWPSLHRYGRRCGDRRHYHAVHYHVAARDYYDYYYPRYRYYGAAPVNAHASVIITLPLF